MYNLNINDSLKPGLYCVATPIGNLGDITFRAIYILNKSHIILSEDTRVSSKLLSKFNIKTKLLSNHKFNEKKNVKNVLNLLRQDKIISIISDAGTLKRVDYSYIKPDTYIHYQNVRTSAVSAGDAYIQLTSLFDSTYAVYKMFLYNINMSADSKIRLQLVTGSSTLEGDSGDYKYAGNGKNSDGQGSDWSSNSSTVIELTGETLRQDAGMIGGIEVTIYDPADTNLRTRVVMQGGATRTGNYTYSAFGTAETTFTTAVTGVRVSAETGNFDSLKVKVFGIV